MKCLKKPMVNGLKLEKIMYIDRLYSPTNNDSNKIINLININIKNKKIYL